jgi:hypothetical protein
MSKITELPENFFFEADILTRDNTTEFDSFEKLHPGLSIQTFKGSSPIQSEGIFHTLPFVFHYYNKKATFKVGEDPIGLPLYQSEVETKTNETSISLDDFFSFLDILIPRLEKAPFLYRFRKRRSPKNTNSEIYLSWGKTSKEAYDLLLVNEEHKSSNIDPTPLENDTRKFPKKDPVFR